MKMRDYKADELHFIYKAGGSGEWLLQAQLLY